ncbi:hypothetical protein [Streptomyces sp. AC495_CC817]|uniref:hypothetical protein n=1 Tax=Streptomyces sp. AC495_CC817 TaxID=2823900 RepID=UPI001C271E32|nr:hypothetical protein [Streptomyces sp. AC495_CC817]
MGTGRSRSGVAVAASLVWALTGCGGGGVPDDGVGDGGRDGSRPEERQRPTTAPASAPADERDRDAGRGTADDTGTGTGTGHGTVPGTETAPDADACFDGRCVLTVSGPRSVEVDSRFGVGDLRVTKVTDDTVVLRSSGAGTVLSSSLGAGGTGGLNGLGFRVKSLQGGTAVLEFFPRA